MKQDVAAAPHRWSPTSLSLAGDCGFLVPLIEAGLGRSSAPQSSARWSLDVGEWLRHSQAGPQRFLNALKIIWMCFSRSIRSKGRGWLVTADMVLDWRVTFCILEQIVCRALHRFSNESCSDEDLRGENHSRTLDSSKFRNLEILARFFFVPNTKIMNWWDVCL